MSAAYHSDVFYRRWKTTKESCPCWECDWVRSLGYPGCGDEPIEAFDFGPKGSKS